MKEKLKEIKKLYPDYLVIIKNNKFGEIYGLDAVTVNEFSNFLNIKLNNVGEIVFCWDLFEDILAKLIRNGIKVAVYVLK